VNRLTWLRSAKAWLYTRGRNSPQSEESKKGNANLQRFEVLVRKYHSRESCRWAKTELLGWCPKQILHKKTPSSPKKSAHPCRYARAYCRVRMSETKWSEWATAANLEEELGSDDFLKEESRLVMRKHDQHTRSVTKTLSETAQAVKLCGRNENWVISGWWGWDQVMMLKLKKEMERGWSRCEWTTS